MATKHILQWNCRGLNANLPELDILIQKFSPAVICLQETLQTENKPINLRKYTHFLKPISKVTEGQEEGSPCSLKEIFPIVKSY